MKVSVYGAGNQDLYVNKLKLPELFGGWGEPPTAEVGWRWNLPRQDMMLYFQSPIEIC